MKLKSLLATAALSLAATAASAVPLGSVAGNIQWKVSGLSTESSNKFGSDESTFVVGAVNTLKSGVNNVWSQGEANQYLYFVAYGIADLSITPGAPNGLNIYGTGATGGSGDGLIHLDVYLRNTAINPSTLVSRTAFDQFSGVTDGGASLYLSLVLVPGGILDDPATAVNENLLATIFQNVTNPTLPATGAGGFWAEVTGGSAAGQWDTNSLLGGAADMRGSFTLTANTDPSTSGDFPGVIDDPITSYSVPEPGSLALLGLSLAGLGALRRRKAA